MSTIKSSTTSTTAYSVVADTTGTLVFQTGATPTTAMTLSSAQVVTFANPPTATGGGSVSTNTAYGTSALAANTSGASGVAIGNSALLNNTTASNNTAVGYLAMSNNTTGTSNTGFGFSVAGSISATTGAINNITAIGYAALAKTTGDNNTAVGRLASYNNSSGTSNVSVGDSALFNNTTASNNTAVGYQAGYTNTTSADNTFIGNIAGYSTTGNSNSFLGKGAGNAVTSGSGNTIVGRYSGNAGGLDIRTLTNKVVLSDGDGNPYFNLNNSAGVGTRTLNFDCAEFFPSIDNVISCGFSSLRWSVVYAATGTINTSDANQKQDIESLDDAEKRVAVAIKSLIKKYRFKAAVAEKGDAARIHVGAVAQEVAAAFVAEGLDPARYALFCSDTWYEINGSRLNSGGEFYKESDEGVVPVTQLGLRYDELLAFVITAI